MYLRYNRLIATLLLLFASCAALEPEQEPATETTIISAIQTAADSIEYAVTALPNNLFNLIAGGFAVFYTGVTCNRLRAAFTHDLITTQKHDLLFPYSITEGVFFACFAHHLQNENAFDLSCEDIGNMCNKILTPTLLALTADTFINRLQFGSTHSSFTHCFYLLALAGTSYKIGNFFHKAHLVFNKVKDLQHKNFK